MNRNKERDDAVQSYAEAYATHYSERDYSAALRSYDQVIRQHPDAPEAEYSHAQIRNIVKSVVPAKELLAAQVELALHHLQPTDEPSKAVAP